MTAPSFVSSGDHEHNRSFAFLLCSAHHITPSLFGYHGNISSGGEKEHQFPPAHELKPSLLLSLLTNVLEII